MAQNLLSDDFFGKLKNLLSLCRLISLALFRSKVAAQLFEKTGTLSVFFWC